MNIQKHSRKRSHPVRKFFAVVVPLILLFVAVQYAVLSVMAVRKHLKALYELEDVQLLSVGHDVDSTYFKLYKEKIWLETRFQISKTDSISLSVDLKDSLLQLELKGVVLKSVKIQEFRYDPFFKYLNTGAYYHYFGVQAVGESALSTIEKEPLKIKKAPKDTIEFANQTHIADSVKTEAVHWLLKLDNGIVVKIEGSDADSKSDWWMGQRFWWQQDFVGLKKDLEQTLAFKVPEYVPQIGMVISEADAKAIYRALPVHPLVCIRY